MCVKGKCYFVWRDGCFGECRMIVCFCLLGMCDVYYFVFLFYVFWDDVVVWDI